MLSNDATAEVPQLKLPPDLVAEVRRSYAGKQTDLRVAAFKPTLWERLARLLGLG
ncbi:MAG TPA: hypothetical protein VK695_05065 [Steroidobacteraceae bacterium]|jgi:hypothetical protein|nr:hypothetical protein [Steroidobacteraceae bacterium]